MQICKTDLGQASASTKIFIESNNRLPFQGILYPGNRKPELLARLPAAGKDIPPQERWPETTGSIEQASISRQESISPSCYQEKTKSASINLFNKKGQHQMVLPFYLNPPSPPL
jgi:hypothetical protein